MPKTGKHGSTPAHSPGATPSANVGAIHSRLNNPGLRQLVMTGGETGTGPSLAGDDIKLSKGQLSLGQSRVPPNQYRFGSLGACFVSAQVKSV